MTDPLHRSARCHLRTFGPPALLGPGGDTLLGTHGHHRRRLALLAVLAASGERGRSRDQLLLLFWPDATEERARHSLDQLLYALRNSIGNSVFDGTNPLRLNAQVVASDVVAFNAALERGDLPTAVAEYRGPFLDGFYLSNAPEFEQWAETERARLAASYAGALQRLAADAGAAQDHAAAIRWWRALAELDPLSNRNAAGLIRALIRAGDQAAALQHAKRYEAVAQQELGMGAGSEVTALVEEARASTRMELALAAPPSSEPTVLPPDVLKKAPPPPRRSVWRIVAAVAVLMLVAVWLVLTNGRLPSAAGRAPVPAGVSIAVLPLANLSGNPMDAPIVDGLTEELIAVLARLGHLRVVARTSAFAFRDTGLGVRRIADSLGVSHIVEGSVQRAGSRLRVRVRLVEAHDGSTRWSETYDRELRDIFVVQSDIAEAVARALDLRLGAGTLAGIRRGATHSIPAYELYLRGNDPVYLRSDSGARAAFEYFRQAVALDSGYAGAYAGLARMHMNIGTRENESGASRRRRLALAEQWALKAVRLDTALAEAHATLALVRRNQYDFAAAEAGFKRAVELDPNSTRSHEWLVQLYMVTDRPREALAEANRAQELDPLSPTAHAEVARALFANDRCDEALEQVEKLRSLRPPLLRAGLIAAQCYARREMWPQAIAELQRSSGATTRGRGLLAFMHARAGRRDEAGPTLAALLEQQKRSGGDAFEIATVYAGLGDKDQAFAWLERAFEDRTIAIDFLPTVLEGLLPDPRVEAFRRRFVSQNR